MRLLITGANQPHTKHLLRMLLETTTHTLFVTGSVVFQHERIRLLHTMTQRQSPHFGPELLKLCVQHSIQAILPTHIEELEALACISPEFSSHSIRLLCPSLQTITTCCDLWNLVQATQPWVRTPTTHTYLERPYALYTPTRLVHRYKHDLQRPCTSLQDLQRIPPDPSWLLQEHIEAPTYKIHAYTTPDGITHISPHVTHSNDIPPPAPSQVAHMSRLTRTLALHLRLVYASTITFQCTEDDTVYLLRIEPILTHHAAHTPLLQNHLRDFLASIDTPTPQHPPTPQTSASWNAPRLAPPSSPSPSSAKSSGSLPRLTLKPISQPPPKNTAASPSTSASWRPPARRIKTPPPYRKNTFHSTSYKDPKQSNEPK